MARSSLSTLFSKLYPEKAINNIITGEAQKQMDQLRSIRAKLRKKRKECKECINCLEGFSDLTLLPYLLSYQLLDLLLDTLQS